MLYGHSLFELAKAVGQEVQQNCREVERPAALWRESEILYAARARPDCVDKPSIRLCAGFRENRLAMVLRAMETDFKCSTFCNDPDLPAVARTLFSPAGYTSSCRMMLVRNLE